ncbi:MAG: YgiQ family radical SAM protein [Nanoarchaeota archaeon]
MKNPDIIFILGEVFFDHPLCGAAILKRLLEKNGYTVAIIEKPETEQELKQKIDALGHPKLFFGVSSGSIDSMVRNYTPLNRKRSEDKNLDYDENVPDRAIIVYCNWLKKYFPGCKIILGGTEATLRRFVHYDYWQNCLRKSILLDSRADILVYGNGEKQILEIARRLKERDDLAGIEGTCIVSRNLPPTFATLSCEEEVMSSKEKFCDLQLQLNNHTNLAQKTGKRYVLQHKSPAYTSKDLDEYYEMPFTRSIPLKHLLGFEFSIVTHRGCIGNCSFCALRLVQGDRIISRSEESILKEISSIACNPEKFPFFKGNIDDLGGPSANMYGIDCPKSQKCLSSCINCQQLDKSHSRLISLMQKAKRIKRIKNIYVRSGIRFDLAPKEYIKEVAEHHIYDTLRIAPEHCNKKILQLMNKNSGNFADFVKFFNSLNCGKQLSYYFMIAHPGSSMAEAEELAKAVNKLNNADKRHVNIQIFTPVPMTLSTCMYYTGMNPLTKEKIYIPYSFREKKEQKRTVMKELQQS